MRVKGLATSVMAVALGACAQTTWQSEKFSNPNYTEQPKAIFAAFFLDQGVDGNKFTAEIESKLHGCGVTIVSSVFSGVSYSGNPSDFMGAAPRETDAYLVLYGKETLSTRFLDAYYGGAASKKYGLYFNAELYDRNGARAVWKSEIYTAAQIAFTKFTSTEKAENLAHGLMGYLVADGVVKNCPVADKPKS